MKTVALKGLLGRKTRAILTGLAIVLGVAMISGTYVLTDTISKAFDQIFTGSYKNTAAVITGKKVVKFSNSGNATVQAHGLTLNQVPWIAALRLLEGARVYRLLGHPKIIVSGGVTDRDLC